MFTNKSRKDDSITTCGFVCYKEGMREKDKRDDDLYVNYRAETRTNCKAKMSIVNTNGKFEVYNFVEEQNHDLHLPQKTHMLACHRKLTEVQAQEIELADNSGLTQRAAFDLMSNHIDAEAQITNIFWADAHIVLDYGYFGEVISFDTTYCTNKANRPLALFGGLNHHKGIVIFGAALLYDETVASFKWLFETFLKAHGGRKPQTIFTDQDQAMARAIQEANGEYCFCVIRKKWQFVVVVGSLRHLVYFVVML
ncbi:protein FAR1-RELATED SEQUENCE 5-like [Senna tora]|uniref:Protein FAR1-RELATED SEQUENCE 5-like n=1 Tax=Senna tora TaxID=362788 RepID=A0A834SQW7_9FABA|nr:protein FAR1-RELATED SEQUENCE 5-like [Senna tora]